MNPEPRFADFEIVIRARLRVDVTDPDFQRESDTPWALAHYLCDDFVWPDFLDHDYAFVGLSELEMIGKPVILHRIPDPEERTR